MLFIILKTDILKLVEHLLSLSYFSVGVNNKDTYIISGDANKIRKICAQLAIPYCIQTTINNPIENGLSYTTIQEWHPQDWVI